MKRFWPAALLVLSGCAHRFVECNDTLTCRAQRAERELQFARAVADEPAAERLEVEPVSRLVFLDRKRQVVWALDPGLVALELKTGAERWRVPGVSGDSLWRAGRSLAVTTEGEKLPGKVIFVDPAEPTRAVPCSLKLNAPAEAVQAYLHVFDRAGQPYVYWRSSWSYSGGTPPGEDAKERQVNAEACGVVKLDPKTCAASPEPLGDFVWDPPEGRRKALGAPGACGNLSPFLDLPAAAASAPRSPWLLPVFTPASEGTAVRVLSTTDRSNQCRQVTRLTLEVRNEEAALLWSHPLADRVVDVCGPP